MTWEVPLDSADRTSLSEEMLFELILNDVKEPNHLKICRQILQIKQKGSDLGN